MPLTFPSHAAAVVPLKLWRPERFDGVALVIGSTAPDLAYATHPYIEVNGHAWWALIWFCVPVTVLGTYVTRRAAPLVAACLPDGGLWHWRDYGVLDRSRYRWWITAGCAWFGALTHRVWDTFTHGSIDATGQPIAALNDIAFAGLPWWHVLQYASTLLGALAAALMAAHIGRHRLLIAWHGEPEPVAVSRRRFWIAAACASVVGLGVLPTIEGGLAALVVRLLIIAALGLLVGASVASRGARPEPRLTTIRR